MGNGELIPKLLKAGDTGGLVELLAADERETRVEAARALGKLRRSNTVPALVKAMGDEEVPVRRAAAEALANVGQPAIPALVATLEGRGGRLAPYALWALGEIGSPAAVDALMEAAGSSRWKIRWSAVESLGDVGGKRAAQALVQALGDRDERVRNAAGEALQKIGEPALEPLAAALRHPNKITRQAARATLTGIDGPAAQAALRLLRREQLSFWIPVIAFVIGLLLVILWLASVIVF